MEIYFDKEYFTIEAEIALAPIIEKFIKENNITVDENIVMVSEYDTISEEVIFVPNDVQEEYKIPYKLFRGCVPDFNDGDADVYQYGTYKERFTQIQEERQRLTKFEEELKKEHADYIDRINQDLSKASI